ncbi:UBC-like protein [Backusella circina FSU 941]|nr:UBC-like protein [Backusella circina FSU 941]
MTNSSESSDLLPKRSSSLQALKRSSSSFIDRTKNATLSRIKRNSKQPSPQYEEEETRLQPHLTSEYFQKYEIMTEFINLRNPNHCPMGVYVTPSAESTYLWYGVVFIHKGFYRSGAFKFRLNIPENYPNQPPSVTFLTDMFHPLIDINGNVSMSQQFPIWRPHHDYLLHVLYFLKNMFKKAVIDGLNDRYCFNKEAYRLYRTDKAVFSKLAQQCALLSITESYLYEHFPDDNMIRFSDLSEAEYEELKGEILSDAHAS